MRIRLTKGFLCGHRLHYVSLNMAPLQVRNIARDLNQFEQRWQVAGSNKLRFSSAGVLTWVQVLSGRRLRVTCPGSVLSIHRTSDKNVAPGSRGEIFDQNNILFINIENQFAEPRQVKKCLTNRSIQSYNKQLISGHSVSIQECKMSCSEKSSCISLV